MRTRAWAALLAPVLVLALALGPAGLAGASPAPTTAPSAVLPAASSTTSSGGELSVTGAKSFADLSSCLAGADHFLASVVVDESGSLQQTDPDNERVGAIQAALDSLSNLQSTAGGRLDVEASLAVFGSRYTELVGWGSVRGSHGDALDQAVTEQIPTRNQADYTDYRAALQGAQQSLDARAHELDGPTCRAILWFTDGRLDLDGDGAGAKTDDARTQLCQQQGIVDGVRADGITIVAMALFGGAGSGVTSKDRARLKAVAEGRGGGGVTCGTVPIPSTSQGGAYLRADRPDALRRLFAGVGALLEGGTPAASGVECPGPSCLDGRLDVPLDAGVAAFRVIIEVPSGGKDPSLRAPDGTIVPLVAGTRTVGAAKVTTTVRDGLVVADVTRTELTGATWRLTAGSGGTDIVDLYYFWGARLSVTAPDGVVLGRSNTVTVALTSADGQPVDPAALDGLAVTATVDAEPSKVARQADGTFALTVRLPAARASSTLHVSATARARSVPHGISLGPVTADAALKTSLPPSYPTLDPSSLELGDVVGDAAGSGVVTVHGSDRGVTKACFGASVLDGPGDAGKVTVADAGCVDVPKDGTKSVKLTAAAEHPADGHASGTVPVRLSGVGTDQVVTLDLPVSVGLVRPVDQGKRAGLTALLVLGALALAWVVADVGRRRSDRYPLGPFIAAAAVPVVVSADGVRRRDDGALLTVDDFRRVGEPRPRAAFTAQGLDFSRSFRWWWAWSPGRARVRSARGSVVATNGRDACTGDAAGTWAPAPFAVTQQFYLVTDRPRPPDDASSGPGGDVEVPATLVVLADGSRGLTEPIERLTSMLHDYVRWPQLVGSVGEAYAHRDAARAGRSGDRATDADGVGRARRERASAPPAPASSAPSASDAPPDLVAGASRSGAEPDGPPPQLGDAPRPSQPRPTAPRPPARSPSDDDPPDLLG